MRKAYLLIIALAAMTFAAPVSGQSDKYIVVWEVKAHRSARGIDTGALTDFVRGQTTRHLQPQGYSIITEESVALILKKQGKKMETCEDNARCLVEVAGAYGAKYMVSASASRPGRTYFLQLKLFETREGAQVDALTIKGRSVDELIRGIENETGKLFRKIADIKSGGVTFGAGVGKPGPVKPAPDIGEMKAKLPVINLREVDTKFLDLYQAAMKAEEDEKNSPAQKAEAWTRVAMYEGSNPLKKEAANRAREWWRVEKESQPLVQHVSKIYSQWKLDKAKLEKLLSYDDTVVSKKQKKAYKQEFERAYGPWEKELAEVEANPGRFGAIEWIFSKRAKASLSKTEITVFQYEQCVNSGGCKPENFEKKSDQKNCNWGYSDRDKHPMNCVNWFGAKEYCEWADGRLPKEKEWEAEASNGGSRGYPWGNQRANCSYAVVDAGGTGCGKGRTWPVCSKHNGDSANGLCDMSGNVWEWTDDWYGSDRQSRVLRGGSWSNYLASDSLYASYREFSDPKAKLANHGFRCARDQ